MIRRVLRLGLALAVLCGVFQSGARYFYCEALGLSASDPCGGGAPLVADCPLESLKTPSPGARSLEAPSLDCCEVIRVPVMPDGSRSDRHGVRPASVVALVSALEYTSARLASLECGRQDRMEQRRKPPRSASRLRAMRMVSLT